jgi:hypothetical protein
MASSTASTEQLLAAIDQVKLSEDSTHLLAIIRQASRRPCPSSPHALDCICVYRPCTRQSHLSRLRGLRALTDGLNRDTYKIDTGLVHTEIKHFRFGFTSSAIAL